MHTEPSSSPLTCFLLALAALIVVALTGGARAQDHKPLPPLAPKEFKKQTPFDGEVWVNTRVFKDTMKDQFKDLPAPKTDLEREASRKHIDEFLKNSPRFTSYPSVPTDPIEPAKPKGVFAQGWDVIKQAWAWALAFPIAAVLLFIAITGLLDRR